MLLWINGPFGGGKTQTAYEIQRRLPGSVVCDPEHVGFGLQRMMPTLLRGDFTVLQRLRERGFGHVVQLIAGKDAPLRRESFAVSRLDLCLERLRQREFAEHVWTDRLTVPQVADRIAASAGLTSSPTPRPHYEDACAGPGREPSTSASADRLAAASGTMVPRRRSSARCVLCTRPEACAQ
jgi:hypothetical protein